MSVYRSSLFIWKGIREFSSSGFEKASKTFNPSDLDVNLSGKSYVITGANSGIGKATAHAIALKGGTIHMVCRDQGRGQAAMEELKEQTGNSEIFLHILDMSNPANVYKFCNEFSQNHHSVDALLNNAGCLENEYVVDENGLEKNFATNTLGPFIMTKQMMPLLEKSSEPRIITVSSGGMLLQKLNVTDLNFKKMIPFDGTAAYSQTKRQEVIMMEKMGEENTDMHFWSMHPGWAATPAVKTSIPKFYESWKSYFKTPEQGADTLIWLAISPAALKHPNGSFFQDRQSVSKHLPMAWTKETPEESATLMKKLNDYMEKFS